jgi:Fe-S-cluster containining protein
VANPGAQIDSEPASATSVVAGGRLRVGDAILDVELSVPSGPTGLATLLPLVRAFANEVVAVAERRERGAGRRITCRAGCGACCRQLVPLAMTEAYQLRDLIEALPESQRVKVRARFDAAVTRLHDAGLLPSLEQVARLSREERVALGREYFALGIPCPFLEQEACSIHPQRPLSCREYLVTSPAVHCSDPTGGKVAGVKLDASVLDALIQAEAPSPEQRSYVPMILAPYLTRPTEERSETGPDWTRRLIEQLTGSDVGDATTATAK